MQIAKNYKTKLPNFHVLHPSCTSMSRDKFTEHPADRLRFILRVFELMIHAHQLTVWVGDK